MSKKKDQQKALIKSFNAVMKTWKKQPDKKLRMQIADSLREEFKKVIRELKHSSGKTSEQAADADPEILPPAIIPSDAVVEEMRAAITAS